MDESQKAQPGRREGPEGGGDEFSVDHHDDDGRKDQGGGKGPLAHGEAPLNRDPGVVKGGEQRGGVPPPPIRPAVTMENVTQARMTGTIPMMTAGQWRRGVVSKAWIVMMKP